MQAEVCQQGCVRAPDGNERREGLCQRATGKVHQRVEGCWAGKGLIGKEQGSWTLEEWVIEC